MTIKVIVVARHKTHTLTHEVLTQVTTTTRTCFCAQDAQASITQVLLAEMELLPFVGRRMHAHEIPVQMCSVAL